MLFLAGASCWITLGGIPDVGGQATLPCAAAAAGNRLAAIACTIRRPESGSDNRDKSVVD